VAVVYAPPGYLIFVSGKRIHSGDGTLVAQPFDVRKSEIRGDPIPLADSVDTWTPLGIPYGNFSVSENGVLTYLQRSTFQRTQLVWFDRNGKEVGEVGKAEMYGNLALAPDGNAMTVSMSGSTTSAIACRIAMFSTSRDP
jgi:hypothetical protein